MVSWADSQLARGKAPSFGGPACRSRLCWGGSGLVCRLPAAGVLAVVIVIIAENGPGELGEGYAGNGFIRDHIVRTNHRGRPAQAR